LAASSNTHITSFTDGWAESNNISVAAYGSITYDATSDLLILEFYGQNNEAYGGLGFEGYLAGEFKTAEDIYSAGIAYGG
jgi:hypothetical protein